ncbi:MAG: hypothetical protein K2X87_10455 [Gemmataceae bacterium]|nr:hypothetical protein [Gemmataceae bacterium]
MSRSLRADAASALTKAVVGRFAWDREGQMVEAYRELLPVVLDALDRYDRAKAHTARRLKPLGQPKGDDRAAQ